MKLIKRCVFILLLFLVFVVAMVLASENSSEVSLRFLSYESPSWPVSWWMLTAFVVGVLSGSLLNLFSNTRLRLRRRTAEKQKVQTARELDQQKARLQPDQIKAAETNLQQ